MVIFEDIPFPASCNECRFKRKELVCQCIEHVCAATGRRITSAKPDWCPARDRILCKDCRFYGRCYIAGQNGFGDSDYCSFAERPPRKGR